MDFADAVYILIAALWAGVIVGVSFLAAPAKFGASLLSRTAALDVGRRTFKILLRTEFGLALALGIVCALTPSHQVRLIAWALLTVIVAAQYLWLWPALNARAQTIIDGNAPPPQSHHKVYIVIEAAKAGLLIGLALTALLRLI